MAVTELSTDMVSMVGTLVKGLERKGPVKGLPFLHFSKNLNTVVITLTNLQKPHLVGCIN